MFTMFFLVKLTIAIVIVCGILSPILASPHNKLSTLFFGRYQTRSGFS